MQEKVEKLEMDNDRYREMISSREAELDEYRKQLGISGSEETYSQAIIADRIQRTEGCPSKNVNPES